ncbi:MAG: ABC transporter ATP-binding protein [Myxococcales bacterium]|nr:ABC transporter ATP-binding protein [Myxococcales bacterium]
MIEATELEKHYGDKRALGPVSFTISEGEAVGFLGLNGAGKTTALRVLACDLRPSAGSVRVGGIDAVESPHEVRRQVGFLPETPPLYLDMTVGDYLDFAGRLRGMTAGAVRDRLPEVLKATNLTEVKDDIVRQLSHGYRQRVGVAQAIVHRPKLLVLDEPTRGLDPVQIVEMRQMIRDLKKTHTILVSSHILPEISETCDRLLVIRDGAIVAAGTEAELSSGLLDARSVVLEVAPGAGGEEAVLACARAAAGVTRVDVASRAHGVLELNVDAALDARAELCRVLVGGGHGVLRLDRARHQLESIFLELVQGRTDSSKGAT